MRRFSDFLPRWYVPAILLWSLIFFCWTFLKTDPNLYFSSQPALVSVQQSAWQAGQNPSTVVGVYLLLVIAAFALYLFAVNKRVKYSGIFLILPFVLMGSNIALSHDLFNYMFNAKAVLLYHQDPHLLSALEIAPSDEWLRFMHNVHTTAPYGKFWTYMTSLPYILGLGRFLTTYLSFKLFMGLGVLCLALTQLQLIRMNSAMYKDGDWRWLFLNPLFLIETFSSGHNDVWMMTFVFISFLILEKTKQKQLFPTIASFLFLILSTQIKLATIVLLPIWIGIWCIKNLSIPKQSPLFQFFRFLERYWADSSAVLLLLPLVTSRSQLFHPWYLIWALSFVPFMKIMQLRQLIILLSVSSLLRYIPFLWVGEYSPELLKQSQFITWSAVPIWLIWMLFIHFRNRVRYNE